ncbi:MAG: hypothetical protein IJM74_04725 [Bacteroidales bacterium]|nr:hypothetical protein [Bacteroidales bacterium]
MTSFIRFEIHTPRLRRTPLKRGLAVAVCMSLTKNTECEYKRHGGSVRNKRHGGSVPFIKGSHASGGVCMPLAEPA